MICAVSLLFAKQVRQGLCVGETDSCRQCRASLTAMYAALLCLRVGTGKNCSTCLLNSSRDCHTAMY